MINVQDNYGKKDFDISKLKNKDVLTTFKNETYIYVGNNVVVKSEGRIKSQAIFDIVLDVKNIKRDNIVIANRTHWKKNLKLSKKCSFKNTSLILIKDSTIFNSNDFKRNDLIILDNGDVFVVDSDSIKATNIKYNTVVINCCDKINEIKAIVRDCKVIANRKNILTGHNVQKRKEVLINENL